MPVLFDLPNNDVNVYVRRFLRRVFIKHENIAGRLVFTKRNNRVIAGPRIFSLRDIPRTDDQKIADRYFQFVIYDMGSSVLVVVVVISVILREKELLVFTESQVSEFRIVCTRSHVYFFVHKLAIGPAPRPRQFDAVLQRLFMRFVKFVSLFDRFCSRIDLAVFVP